MRWRYRENLSVTKANDGLKISDLQFSQRRCRRSQLAAC